MKIDTLNDYDIETVTAIEDEAELIEWLNGHGYGTGMIKEAVKEWKHLRKEKKEKAAKEKAEKEAKDKVATKPTAPTA